jgi:hypothetical protein
MDRGRFRGVRRGRLGEGEGAELRLKAGHIGVIADAVPEAKICVLRDRPLLLRLRGFHWLPFRHGLGVDHLLPIGRRDADPEVGVEGAMAGDVHPRAVLARIASVAADLSLAARQAACGSC